MIVMPIPIPRSRAVAMNLNLNFIGSNTWSNPITWRLCIILGDIENVSFNSVKFSVMDETRDTAPLIGDADAGSIEMSYLNAESR